MAWVIDTCLLIDIEDSDPQFAHQSASLLALRRPNGLVISPVTYVEMAPVFEGDQARLEKFLFHLEVSWQDDWTFTETQAAFAAWYRYLQSRRMTRIAKRPMADILIGGFAEKFDGLLTRNVSDFRSVFPSLPIQAP